MPALSSYHGLYKSLGVATTASHDEIRRAYREKALATHPDRAPPDQKVKAAEAFRAVQTAYEILSDEDKRREYDAVRRECRASRTRSQQDASPSVPPRATTPAPTPARPTPYRSSLKESFRIEITDDGEQIFYRLEDQNGNVWELKNGGTLRKDKWTRNGERCSPPEGSSMRMDWVRNTIHALESSRTANANVDQAFSSNQPERGKREKAEKKKARRRAGADAGMREETISFEEAERFREEEKRLAGESIDRSLREMQEMLREWEARLARREEERRLERARRGSLAQRLRRALFGGDRPAPQEDANLKKRKTIWVIA